MRQGLQAMPMPTVSTSTGGYAGAGWAIFGQLPNHSNAVAAASSTHSAHALFAAHGAAGFAGAAALFATVSAGPYSHPAFFQGYGGTVAKVIAIPMTAQRDQPLMSWHRNFAMTSSSKLVWAVAVPMVSWAQRLRGLLRS
uniref:NADH dehydrogenase subunit 5 n=1 Tax=Globodera pallida TaxID=36090 RepID=A0A183BMS9_GLOPA